MMQMLNRDNLLCFKQQVVLYYKYPFFPNNFIY